MRFEKGATVWVRELKPDRSGRWAPPRAAVVTQQRRGLVYLKGEGGFYPEERRVQREYGEDLGVFLSLQEAEDYPATVEAWGRLKQALRTTWDPPFGLKSADVLQAIALLGVAEEGADG